MSINSYIQTLLLNDAVREQVLKHALQAFFSGAIPIGYATTKDCRWTNGNL